MEVGKFKFKLLIIVVGLEFKWGFIFRFAIGIAGADVASCGKADGGADEDDEDGSVTGGRCISI